MTFIIGTTISPDPRTGLAAAKTLDGHLDFAIVSETFTGIDPLEFASWLGPLTSELGLIAEVRVTHTEPFHLATASATADFTARARFGLAIDISTSEDDAALIGRRGAAAAGPAWAEAAQVIDALRRLWDSWDDDAIIRDQSTDRYIDRDRLHVVDAELTDSVGTDYSVHGPSITPRPPQGHPPIVVRADAFNAAAVKAADIVIVDADASAASDSRGPSIEVLRERVGSQATVLAAVPAPTAPAEVARIVDLARELESRGASGIVFSSAPSEQLEFSIRLVSEIIPALTAAGLRASEAAVRALDAAATSSTSGQSSERTAGTAGTSGIDLRTRLGLPPAHSLFAHA